MDIRFNFTLLTLIAFLCGAFLISSIACNTKSEKSSTTSFEEKPVVPAPNPEDRIDTNRRSTAITETQPATDPKTGDEPKTSGETKSAPKPTAKICSPAFNLIGKPKNNRHIYYITGFNPGEFKCWAELEAHGQKICQGEPCIIYYLDSPEASVNNTPPHFIDPAILKANGIGQFEHTNHWWEMKGAKQVWGRPGKEFVYYNTNNNAGG